MGNELVRQKTQALTGALQRSREWFVSCVDGAYQREVGQGLPPRDDEEGISEVTIFHEDHSLSLLHHFQGWGLLMEVFLDIIRAFVSSFM